MEEILKAFNNKEKYYSQAEIFLLRHEVAAEIDREKFGANKSCALISLKPINVHYKRLIKKIRKLKEIKEEPHTKERNPTVIYFLLMIPREEE